MRFTDGKISCEVNVLFRLSKQEVPCTGSTKSNDDGVITNDSIYTWLWGVHFVNCEVSRNRGSRGTVPIEYDSRYKK